MEVTRHAAHQVSLWLLISVPFHHALQMLKLNISEKIQYMSRESNASNKLGLHD